MAIPDWRTFPGGGTKRAALWLLAEVGEGETFTKEQLRAAFPGESQIDRRVRDLRDEGWVIHTSREDATLYLEEQRLVTVGGHVWEKGYQSRKEPGPSAKERQAVFAADNYACSFCGITAGEQYPDDPLSRAKLSVSRAAGPGGGARYATVCGRCQQGRATAPDPAGVLLAASTLDAAELAHLVKWVREGRRRLTAVERVWADYRRLPSESRAEFADWLLRSS
jgi:hypothetical protein